MATDACFVCFRSGRCNLSDVAVALAATRLVVEQNGDEISVGRPHGPSLRIAYVCDDFVAEEAEEIAARNAHAATMLPCEARFEILIDDLDAVLDEYSTLFDVQEILAEMTGGFLFNTWNGRFPWDHSDA